MHRRSEREVAVHKDGHLAAVVRRAGDGEVARADHEVHMRDRIIQAAGLQLVLAQAVAVLEAGIRFAEGDVAGGVLVEERVIKQDLQV